MSGNFLSTLGLLPNKSLNLSTSPSFAFCAKYIELCDLFRLTVVLIEKDCSTFIYFCHEIFFITEYISESTFMVDVFIVL